MISTRGEYHDSSNSFGVIMNYSKHEVEIVLVSMGQVASAFKHTLEGDYSFLSSKAKDVYKLIQSGISGCKAKNGQSLPFELGTCVLHEFTKAKVEYSIELFNGEVCGAEISAPNNSSITLEYYSGNNLIPANIPYIQLTANKIVTDDNGEEDLDAVVVRSVQEIALEKEDVSWLKNKRYYIVNDDAEAEKIFKVLDNYNGLISYDTETTGLKINCFGKINSPYKKRLEQYNLEHPNEPLRADRLVGIIFCVEDNISYYFPCFNRKFKNLYETDTETRRNIINIIKSRYTIGEFRDKQSDMADYIRNTPAEEWGSDVILMERVRHILEKLHIVAHNGSFEWKVGWQYEIDTNLKDDTMLMHQIMYKFRTTTSNRGEPSNLKYLARVELGVDQWELSDFFPNYKEDETGKVKSSSKKKKKKGSKIDFSYMDYEGTRVYAPTDGDVTLQLCKKYKADMVKNHKELEYIYNVEVIVSCAIGYMEFYGHRLDEDKIASVRDQTRAEIACLESEIRQTIEYANQKEIDAYNELKNAMKKFNEVSKTGTKEDCEQANNLTLECVKDLYTAISENTEHELNLGSAAQVATLFYDILGYPLQGDKKSVAAKAIKPLVKAKNEDGSPTYPVAKMYSDYKAKDTLMTKFFDALPDYMYPGGFIFSSFGQISTATGRMSCIEENTPITLVGGTKPIKNVKVGDLVYCYDNEGNLKIRKVLNVIDNGYKNCIKLTWRSRDTQSIGELICTPDHNILSRNRGWVEANNLNKFEEVLYLRESSNNKPKTPINKEQSEFNNHDIIIECKETVGIKHVYDLEVEEYHNFIANEICVHNCSKPNAQQYPKSVTSIVCPRDGYVMMDADYSQIEYRVLTALAGNEELAELFSDPDSDYHTLMASMMYGVDYASVTPKMRSDAKSFNFGIPYGMGFNSLAILLTGNKKQSSVEEAKEKYELYFKNQPKTRKFFDHIKEMAQVNKYTKTFWNRYRYYSFTDADGNENNAKKAAALRQAGNAVIQGCLGSGVKLQTKEYGIVEIQDVVNQHLHVWDGDKWSEGDILYSGKKRKCIVKFTTGQTIICSPTHKFLVKSAKGNERFVECQDLKGRNVSKSPHRVVINREYEPSDWEYSSNWARPDFISMAPNSNNVFIDDIGDSFKAGVVLGRLASDGSIFNREVGASSIRQIIAEHEQNITPVLMEYMQNLGASYKMNDVRENRNERVDWINVYSKSLVQEIDTLDIKHQLPKQIFQDTEMLRGFLRGMFDGDGGISGKTITLVFGTQYDFEPMCRDIQKALLFFGIRSRYYKYDYRYKITISTYDNQKFLDLIGFINEDKQSAGRDLGYVKRDEHIFGSVLNVESVEITDEYIDMYDVCNTDGGYYVADGIITHNTAADIFKISVARNFIYIRENNLLGLLLIINMVHDEQLMEVDVSKLNIQRVLADVGKNMQFKIEGFPPLYIGAGIGPAWAKAKGKMAEIHPLLLNQFTDEAYNIPLWKTPDQAPDSPKDVLNYFDNRVFEFRRQKVANYLLNPDNYGKDLHPAIGNLLNLQFTYGHDKDKEGLNDAEFTQLCLTEFISHNNLENVKAEYFVAKEASMDDPEEDEEYNDGEEDDFDDIGDIDDNIFTLVDESNVIYGSTIQDLIAQFHFFVSAEYGICGIDSMNLSYKKKDELVDYLCSHLCEPTDDGAMELVFLQEGNILNRTGVFINGINGSDIEDKIV